MNRIALLLLAFSSANAQPAFDVASIRAADGNGTYVKVVPGSVSMRMRFISCIAWAYRVQEFQISGPGWLADTWFDISAKSGTPAQEEELRLMMRTLLADRFKLAFHRENKEMQALILTVSKTGHKLTPNDIEGKPSFKTGKMNLTGDGATLSQMAEFLSREMRYPVIDQTGLTGRFNYFLDINAYVTEEMRKADRGPTGGPPEEATNIIAQAMQKQLGLKVESKKLPVEVLIVDRVEKAPTEN